MASESCVKGKWRSRFKRCLCICCESNTNLAEEAKVLQKQHHNAKVAEQLGTDAKLEEGQSSNRVEPEDSNLQKQRIDLVEEQQLGTDAKLEEAQRSNPVEEDKEQGSDRGTGTLEERLDNLLNEIKLKIQSLSSSTAASKWQNIIGRKDIISSFMKSFPDDVKKEVDRAGGAWLMPLVKDALGGVGAVHWLGLGMSLIAWALDNIEQTSQNHDDCVKILQRIVPVLSNSKEILQANAIKEDITVIEILQNTVGKVFRCVIVCTDLLNNCYVQRFLKVSSAKDAIVSLNGDLDSVVEELGLFIKTRTLVSTLQIDQPRVYFDSDDDYDSVGGSLEAEQKAMEYLEGDPHNTKAVCLYGMGGIGKSTLGLRIYKKFQRKPSYRCCMVELSFGIEDEQLHKIQNEILKEFLRHVKGLQILNLAYSDGLANVEGISELKGLERLELSGCKSLQSLPDGIARLTGLVSLSLEGFESLQSLPQGISELKGLKWLMLSGCKSLQSLPDGIARLTGLKGLYLRECESLQSLPQGISELKGLEQLVLSGCKSLQSLPDGIARLTGLEVLDLSGCKSLQSLPKGTSELKGLRCVASLLDVQRAPQSSNTGSDEAPTTTISKE